MFVLFLGDDGGKSSTILTVPVPDGDDDDPMLITMDPDSFGLRGELERALLLCSSSWSKKSSEYELRGMYN